MSQETDQQILDALPEIRDGRGEIIAALAAALMLVHAAVSVAAGADPDRRTERVRFAAGATSTVIKGEIRGRQYNFSVSSSWNEVVSPKPGREPAWNGDSHF